MAVNNNNNLNNNNNNTIDPDAKVVRIDADSAEDNLQALFDSVLQPAENRRMPLQMPLRMRNLPSSFFKPPTTGSKSPSVSHSRENSADSAFGSGTTTICSPTGGGGINTVTSRLQISHSRAHSSPASLQQTYAGLSPQAAAAVAAAQQSANAANNNNNAVNSVVVGGGGAGAGSGSAGGTTSGAAGGAGNAVAGANVSGGTTVVVQQQQQQQRQTITPNHMKQRSYDVVSAIQLQEELGDLPPGWEQARTAEGQIYYLK